MESLGKRYSIITDRRDATIHCSNKPLKKRTPRPQKTGTHKLPILCSKNQRLCETRPIRSSCRSHWKIDAKYRSFRSRLPAIVACLREYRVSVWPRLRPALTSRGIETSEMLRKNKNRPTQV